MDKMDAPNESRTHAVEQESNPDLDAKNENPDSKAPESNRDEPLDSEPESNDAKNLGEDSGDRPENNTEGECARHDVFSESVKKALAGFKESVKGSKIKICVGAGIIILIIAGVRIGIPAFHYFQGEQALASGDYLEAVAAYEKSDWFGPSQEHLSAAARQHLDAGDWKEASLLYSHSSIADADAYRSYCDGMLAVEEGSWEEAVELFGNAGDVQNADEMRKQAAYNFGQQLFESKDYEKAIEQFTEAGDHKGAKSALVKATYQRGKQLMNDGKYESARSYFVDAGDYKDAKKWVATCDDIPALLAAEDDYQAGNLSSAQKGFGKLPRSLTWDGISVAKRQDTLADHQAFVDICGRYKISSGECEVRQTHSSTGIWYNWTADLSDMGYSAEVRCTIKKNGKVKVSGSVDFYRYTSYSSISEGVNGTNDTTDFSFTTSSLPNDKSVGNYSSITCSGKKLKFHYGHTDNTQDVYFTYLYRTDATYKKTSSF